MTVLPTATRKVIPTAKAVMQDRIPVAITALTMARKQTLVAITAEATSAAEISVETLEAGILAGATSANCCLNRHKIMKVGRPTNIRAIPDLAPNRSSFHLHIESTAYFAVLFPFKHMRVV